MYAKDARGKAIKRPASVISPKNQGLDMKSKAKGAAKFYKAKWV